MHSKTANQKCEETAEYRNNDLNPKDCSTLVLVEVENGDGNWIKAKCFLDTGSNSSLVRMKFAIINKTNDLILNLTPENVTQHSRIVTTTRKGSSTPTKMSKIIGRQIH